MTIAVGQTTTFVRLPCNGVTTTFNFPNKIFQAADLVVLLIDLTGATYPFTSQANSGLGLNYTVNGVDVDTGCSVQMNNPPTNGWSIDIRSLVPEQQTTSIKNQGQFLPELHEEFFDRATRMLQDLYRLGVQFSIHGPDNETVPWTTLPKAAVRANGGLVFDNNGLPTIGVLSSNLTTKAVVLALLQDSGYRYVIHPAETAMGLTAGNLTFGFDLADPLRFGAIGNATLLGGGTNDAAAVQLAWTFSSKTGIPVRSVGGPFLCLSDISIPVPASPGLPVAAAVGKGWATPEYVFGTGSTHGFVQLGSGSLPYGVQISDMCIVLAGTSNTAIEVQQTNQPKIRNVWVFGSGTNGRGVYLANNLVPLMENVLVTGCGSATQGSVEVFGSQAGSTSTNFIWRGSRISGGNPTIGGLLVDGTTVATIDSGGIESCGTPIRIESKVNAAGVFASSQIRITNIDLENPGLGVPYVEVGIGLNGNSANTLVSTVKIEGCYGTPSGTATVLYAVRAANFIGITCEENDWTQGAAPTSVHEIVGTNWSGFYIRPHRQISSNVVPWLRQNGTQVKFAGPRQDVQIDFMNGGVPVCSTRGVDAMQGVTLTGVTLTSPMINTTIGGFWASAQVSQGGATNCTGMPILESGAEISLYHADGNTTYVQGVGSGNWLTRSGANFGPVPAGALITWKSNGTAWAQKG